MSWLWGEEPYCYVCCRVAHVCGHIIHRRRYFRPWRWVYRYLLWGGPHPFWSGVLLGVVVWLMFNLLYTIFASPASAADCPTDPGVYSLTVRVDTTWEEILIQWSRTRVSGSR